MTPEGISRIMEQTFTECRDLREAGQAEYAGGDESGFGNFDRLAKELNLPREQVLWVYARKHVDGIAAYLRGHKSQRESVKGRINDLIVYMVLLRAMVEEAEEVPF